MANRFWVLGTGNTSDTAHWSATTGGAGGETVPVAGDTVTFDSNSGTAATVTVDVALSAASITINKSDLTLIHSAGTTLTGAMTLTAGTLNTNGQTCSWASLTINTGTKTLTLGASAITLTTGSTAIIAQTANLTITANTAVFTFTGNGATLGGGNATNWNGASAVLGAINHIIGSADTWAAITNTLGSAEKTRTFQLNSNLVVTGTCTLGGNSTQGVNRMLIQSNTVGTQRTITAAAYVISGDVDFMDINLAYSGGASWTNAGSAYIGDALGNAGAVTTNATVSATQTATGTASFTWSTHGWTSRVPLPQDDVVINNAFVAGRTVTADMPRLGRDIDMSAATGNPVWNLSTAITNFGSLALAVGMTWTGTQNVTFGGRGTHTLSTLGINYACADNTKTVTLNGPNGSYTLGSDFVSANPTGPVLTHNWGSFDASTFNITVSGFNSNSGNTRTLSFGSGVWTINRAGTTNSMGFAAAGLTLNPGTAIIDWVSTSAGTKTFAGGGLTFPTLRHRPAGAGIHFTITGNNTFATLDLECTTARTITFPAGGTQTVTGTLTLLGAAGQLLSLRSSSTGTKWYINAATTSAQYCDVKDSTATGTGTPIDNSTGGVDSGNNIGWLFVAGGSAGYSSTLLTLGVG